MPKPNSARAFSSVTTMSPIHLGSMSFPSYTWNSTILDKINGKTRPLPPPPKIKDKKNACFCASHGFILDIGGTRVSCSIFFQNRPPPPPPKIKDGKMARFCPSRGFILDWWEGGWVFVVPFYSIQDCSPSYMCTGLSQAVRW